MNETALPEQIISNLQRKGQDVAFVMHREKIYASYCSAGFDGPSSAVIKLLQSLFDAYQDQSFFILRNRIFTSAPLHVRCQGMVKTVAKRASGEVRAVHHGLEIRDEVLWLGGAEPVASVTLLTRENQFELERIRQLFEPNPLDWLKKIAALNPRGEVLHDYDRDIACFLTDAAGELLAYGLNCNSKNKTLHAEVNMVQRFYRERGTKIPKGAQLFTTRKPCKMCAGMIFDWSEQPETLTIWYAEDDKSSKHTALDAVVHWNRLDSV